MHIFNHLCARGQLVVNAELHGRCPKHAYGQYTQTNHEFENGFSLTVTWCIEKDPMSIWRLCPVSFHMMIFGSYSIVSTALRFKDVWGEGICKTVRGGIYLPDMIDNGLLLIDWCLNTFEVGSSLIQIQYILVQLSVNWTICKRWEYWETQLLVWALILLLNS